jgi:hypothetical protein
MIHPTRWEDLELRGELGRRARLSFQRLEDYTPAFTMGGNKGWPGDREGRAILGQVLIGQTVRRESAQTEALLAGLPQGILGPPLDLETINEQQLAGHGWMLRGLCEHQARSGRDDVRRRVRGIVDELFLPLRGRLRSYPIDPRRRGPPDGAPAGHLARGVVQGWRLSSDVGAVFIALDGLSHAWETDPRPELEELIEEAIARFSETDPVALGGQTHATLTALRALLRWHRLRGRPALLGRVRALFDTYRREAYTEQHHNWNWFGRPKWTEPCAVVDSFQVATGLWRATGDARYLPIAQEILFTGLARQNHAGGYGCDICTGALGQTAVKVFKDVYDCHWCCTMRGAEGWARAAEWCWCVDGDLARLPWPSDSTAVVRLPGATWKVRQESAYPEDGVSVFTVEAAPPAGAKLDLALYAAPWVDRARASGVASWDGDWAVARLPARAGARVRVDLPFGLRRQPALSGMGGTHVSFRHGPLLLGVEGGSRPAAALGEPEPLGGGRYRAADGSTLEPLGEGTWRPEAECRRYEREVLFAV